MIRFLAQRWFFLALLLGIAAACVRPDWLWPITSRLSPRVLVTVPLFLMACTMEARSLWHNLKRPWPVLWAVFVSYSLVPAVAVAAGWLMPQRDLRIGLIAMASVPCTLASAVIWTRMAGGREAVALLVILLSTASSWIGTTFWLTRLEPTASLHLEPLDLMGDLVLVLVVPVIVGQLSRLVRPLAALMDRRRLALGVVSQLMVLAIILKAVVDVRLRLGSEAVAPSAGMLLWDAALCLATHLAGFFGGLWGGAAFGFDRPNRIAVAFSSSQKALPVALFLFDRYFKTDFPLAVVSMAFYHVGQLLVDTLLADYMLKREKK